LYHYCIIIASLLRITACVKFGFNSIEIRIESHRIAMMQCDKREKKTVFLT